LAENWGVSEQMRNQTGGAAWTTASEGRRLSCGAGMAGSCGNFAMVREADKNDLEILRLDESCTSNPKSEVAN
jgi:hypothetical protein